MKAVLDVAIPSGAFLVMGVVGGIFPAVRAARVNVLDALRG